MYAPRVRVVILLIGMVAFAAAQDHSNHLNLPIIADGSKNPEKIPDQVAYLLFVLQASEYHQPNKQEMDRRRALFLRLNLSQQDQNAMLSALDGVREQLDTLDWSGAVSASGAAARDAAFSRVLSAALLRLRASLSQDGSAKLDRFVQKHVKSHIVMFGTAP